MASTPGTKFVHKIIQMVFVGPVCGKARLSYYNICLVCVRVLVRACVRSDLSGP